ncbi:MAG: hypothetical protein ACKPKO_17690, partial [Candidatus Fonsibacter sp.]
IKRSGILEELDRKAADILKPHDIIKQSCLDYSTRLRAGATVVAKTLKGVALIWNSTETQRTSQNSTCFSNKKILLGLLYSVAGWYQIRFENCQKEWHSLRSRPSNIRLMQRMLFTLRDFFK